MDSAALSVTFSLAVWTTLVLAVIGLPISYGLARASFPGRFLVEALISLPILLPPTVIGFYLLLAMSPTSPLGQLSKHALGQSLPFSFPGIVLASVIYNLPFTIRPFIAGFASIDPIMMDAAACLGLSRWESFIRIAIPLAWPGIISGMVLTFAHTVGEFGVVLMVGGSIPGVTRTLSVAIYDDVQALDYAAAGQTSLALVIFSIIVLSLTYALTGRRVPL
ncbi:molybdate ABC transporter permease subunit [bacterium]|nr:molybdate ABC transporter permease subunit [bacterium]